MNEIVAAVEKSLKKSSVTMERFQQLVSRLLGRGILCFGDSQMESELYNDALRIESVLSDYFFAMGARLEHDYHVKFFRLYPPGVDTAAVTDDDEGVDHSLREQLSQHETACVLILRLLYDQALQEGDLDDEHEVHITMESLHTALHTRLKRSLPDRVTERKNLFRKLKRYKLIRYAGENEMEKPEGVIVIRPMIVGFVTTDALDALTPADNEPKT